MINNIFRKNKRKFLTKGFTLVEFMVVIGIFLILTGIILSRYTNIRSIVSIDNLTQDIAISIRKAQLFSVGVRETEAIGSKIIPPGYGINIQSTGSGPIKEYVFFADLDFPVSGGNKVYDDASGGVDCGTNFLQNNHECLDRITINTEDYIQNTYVDGSVCNQSLDIVFTRPNLVATISCGGSFYDEAKIELSNPDGIIKNIVIPTAGNIYVE